MTVVSRLPSNASSRKADGRLVLNRDRSGRQPQRIPQADRQLPMSRSAVTAVTAVTAG